MASSTNQAHPNQVHSRHAQSPLDEPAVSLARFDLEQVPPNSTLRAVALQMESAGVSALIVEDGSDQFGIVTESDVVSAIANEADVDLVWSADVMTRNLQHVRADATVADIAELMQVGQIRHVLVKGDGGRIGIVSIRDLLEPLLSVEDRAGPVTVTP